MNILNITEKMMVNQNNSNTINHNVLLYVLQKMSLNQKKNKDKMNNYSYLNRKIEVGDIVQKDYRKNSKFSDRTGTVIRKICGQSIVLWEFAKTPVYEFDKDLKILKMEDQPKPKEQYLVAVFGRVTAPSFFDTYEEAEQEAKRLLLKEQRKTYILKSIAVMEMGDIKINKNK
jgi:hypothetical protein